MIIRHFYRLFLRSISILSLYLCLASLCRFVFLAGKMPGRDGFLPNGYHTKVRILVISRKNKNYYRISI